MEIAFETPILPMNEHGRKSIRKDTFAVSTDKARNTAEHTLHVPEIPRSMNQAFANTTATDNDRIFGRSVHHFLLRVIKVLFHCLAVLF
jgi:hypothetical protein